MEQKVLGKDLEKQKEKKLVNFYSFQMRESKMERKLLNYFKYFKEYLFLTLFIILFLKICLSWERNSKKIKSASPLWKLPENLNPIDVLSKLFLFSIQVITHDDLKMSWLNVLKKLKICIA